MTRTKAITVAVILLGIVSTALVWVEHVSKEELRPEVVRVALRSAGDELLVAAENDSARVLPISSSQEWFIISFEEPLKMEPDQLVIHLNEALEKADLPTDYIAEVRLDESDSVVYSYLMDGDENESIIPCFGRSLPIAKYTVHVKPETQGSTQANLILGSAVLLIFAFVYSAKVFQKPPPHQTSLAIGNYQLRKDERLLTFKNEDIALTEKEVELLVILSSRPNETIAREELQHQVWESKGVVVGRSLDTYISKLRKKLDKDESVLIKNVHGAGYKLEVRNT